MFELAENTGSLDLVTQYELVPSHCLEKLGVNNKVGIMLMHLLLR